MNINIPAVGAEVEAAFARYEAAIVANYVATLNALFHPSPETIHCGVAENLRGFDEIAASRGARSSAGLMRSLAHTAITAHGRDAAVTLTPFRRSATPGKLGRQMQTWIRFSENWQIVAAQVSLTNGP